MPKMPIEWHEECARNSKRYALKEVELAEAQLARAKAWVEEATLYERQIAREGRDGFDRERFSAAISVREEKNHGR